MTPGVHRRGPATTAIVVMLFAGAVLAWHAASFLPFLADDSLISFRYVERLLDGHGLTWTEGPRVEGYSNLAWILLLALPGAFGVDIILASRILGLSAMIATLFVIGWFYFSNRRSDPLSISTGLLGLALSGAMAAWAVGGMEQPLQVLMFALGLTLSFRIIEEHNGRSRAALLASMPLAMLAITRSDGFLFTITIALGLLVSIKREGERWKTIGKLMLLPLLFVVGQQIFRILYYGEWLPNPAYVKISGSEKHFLLGLQYIRDGFIYSWPLTFLTLVGGIVLIVRWRDLPSSVKGHVLILMISLVAWSGYITFVGGDIFPARRHFLPATLLLSMILIEGLTGIWSRLRGVAPRVIMALVLLTTLGAFSYVQQQDPENRRAHQERWEWDGQVVGLMLNEGFGDRQPLLACTAAGCLPYWSKLPCVDMLGLNDYHIARAHPDDFGQGRLAHELGDGRYVLSREPDLVSFCGPSGSLSPCYRSGLEMVRLPEFRQQYTPAKFEGRNPYRFLSVFWVRRFSERIGIEATDSLIRVPAYLINGHSGTVAYLDATNRFVVSIDADDPGVILHLPVAAGTWIVSAPGLGHAAASMRIIIHAAQGDVPLADGLLPQTVILPADMDLNIMVRSEFPIELNSIELRRIG